MQFIFDCLQHYLISIDTARIVKDYYVSPYQKIESLLNNKKIVTDRHLMVSYRHGLLFTINAAKKMELEAYDLKTLSPIRMSSPQCRLAGICLDKMELRLFALTRRFESDTQYDDTSGFLHTYALPSLFLLSTANLNISASFHPVSLCAFDDNRICTSDFYVWPHIEMIHVSPTVKWSQSFQQIHEPTKDEVAKKMKLSDLSTNFEISRQNFRSLHAIHSNGNYIWIVHDSLHFGRRFVLECKIAANFQDCTIEHVYKEYFTHNIVAIGSDHLWLYIVCRRRIYVYSRATKELYSEIPVPTGRGDKQFWAIQCPSDGNCDRAYITISDRNGLSNVFQLIRD
jgi:hypothetical protein